jgi:hypothetical protein
MRKNKTYRKKQTKRQRKITSQFIVIIAFIIGVGVIGHFSIQEPYREVKPKALTGVLPVNADKKVLTIQDKISIAATRSKDDININTALRISWCESRQNPQAKNNQGSSATGLYQFIMKTWWNNCEGDVKNADDNIACFMAQYPKHPSWWKCAEILGYI